MVADRVGGCRPQPRARRQYERPLSSHRSRQGVLQGCNWGTDLATMPPRQQPDMNRILESVTNLSTLTIILIAAAAVLLLFVVWMTRRRRVDLYRDDLPPLIFAVHDRVSAPPNMRPASFGNRTGYQAPEQWSEASTPPYYPPAPPMGPPPASPPPGASQPSPGARNGGTAANQGRDGNGNGQRTRASEATMRVPRYEGPVTMAFLPGRLEVQAAGRTGPRPGEEIRFPARRQGDGIVILGRDDGPSGATRACSSTMGAGRSPTSRAPIQHW